jgi:hypothetical protein
MTELMAVAVPRSETLVKEVTNSMLARSRYLRRWVSLGMMTPAIGTSIVMAFLPSKGGDATAFQISLILMFWAGLVPAAAVYWYFSSNMKVAPRLVRDGVAVSARITKVLDGGGAKYYTFAWTADDGREHYARLKATNVTAPMNEGDSVTILCAAHVKNQVGVILGDNGLYVADGS